MGEVNFFAGLTKTASIDDLDKIAQHFEIHSRPYNAFLKFMDYMLNIHFFYLIGKPKIIP
ncbi:hypothetical protein NUITMVS2_08580 [Shewanella xiamenensis]|nr:hypothetical protein NUITMVS2_08580 [Shewanella xiamenensis]